LVLCSLLGFWELLFQPELYLHLSAVQAYNLALGVSILMCCLITTYLLKLAFDRHISIGLALHHWTAIGLILLAMPALYKLRGDIHTIRALFALSLYMSTEQNVVIEMLMYHRRIYWPCVYYISAVYYALTRLFIMVLCLWTWRTMYDSVSTIPHQSGFVYSLWLVLLPTNILQNFAQALTFISLLGIAQRVAKKTAMYRPVPKKRSIALQSNMSSTSMPSNANFASSSVCSDLEHIFRIIDCNDSGRVTLDSWKGHILGLEFELLLPRSALNRSFDAMDTRQKGFVTWDDFQRFFGPFVIHNVDFAGVMLAIILKVAIESGAYGQMDGALRCEHSKMMIIIQHQYNQSNGRTIPGGDTLFRAALQRLGVKDKVGSLQDDLLQ